MSGLQIADGVSLPIELVTSTQAILARKRSGKSYTASVEAEEMLDHHQQIAVIDPTSAWFGLRSSADGKGPGYSVVVFGGEHADAPLNFRSGKAMARALVEHGFSAIFDIGDWITDEQILFVFEFTSELLRINRTAIHLFLDEADTFAPQLLESKEQKKCLGAVSRLVKQGGIKGIGVTMITQRGADLNKKILSQIDTLTVLRMSHPPDIKPAAEWISANVSPAYAEEVTAALPRLSVGDAFICSGPEGKGQRVRIRTRRTFNSGATPKPGERRVEPKVLAPIDIQKLGAQIADSIREQEANSPEALKDRIAELERKLASGGEQISKEREDMLVEQIQEMETELASYRIRFQKIGEAAETARRLAEQLYGLAGDGPLKFELPAGVSLDQLDVSTRREISYMPPASPVAQANGAPPKADGLDGPSLRVLKALAELEAVRISPAPREQVAVFAGYSNLASKGLVNAMGTLRSAGLIDYPESGKVVLTDAGRAMAPSVSRPASEREFHDRLFSMMGGPEARILQVLIPHRTQPMDRTAVAERAGYSNLASKGFVNAMGRLRTLGLLDYPGPGKVQATRLLYLDRGRA